MRQSFRNVKQDINDRLYSKIIRHGQERCWKCGRVRDLECAHIVGRGSYTTRFLLEPVRNGIPLCPDCHSWFDSHKMRDLIFDPEKRVLGSDSEGYTFLVARCGYTWEQLQKLYLMGQQIAREKYKLWKPLMTKQLRDVLKRLDAGCGGETPLSENETGGPKQ